jgi:hypothetical protein
MCDQAPETVAHLFVGCVFSREVWYKLLEPLGLSSLMPMDEPDLGQWWISQRGHLDRASRPPFDSLVLLIAWTVWKERNNQVFGWRASSVMQVVRAVVHEGEIWALAGYAPLAALHYI